MLHLTFMGGSQIRLSEPDSLIITVWGGTEIFLPTLAEKMLRLRKSRTQALPEDYLIRRANVITFQGGTVLKKPTLAREIEESMRLRETLSDEEYRTLWQEAVQSDDLDQFEMFTVMGGAAEETPSVKEEIRDLERLVLKGYLSKDEVEELRAMIKGEGFSKSRTELIQEKMRNLLLPAASYSLPSSSLPVSNQKASQR
jgi:hypothetical protein